MKALQMNVAAKTLLALLRARWQDPWLGLRCRAWFSAPTKFI